MMPKTLVRALVEEISLSIIVLLVGIFVPLLLLLFGWSDSIADILSLASLANSKSQFYQIFLTQIPFCIFYFLIGIIFIFRSSGNITSARWLFIPCFFIPMVVVLVCLVVMIIYSFLHKDKMLSPTNFNAASAVLELNILGLVAMDIFMSVCDATRKIGYKGRLR